MQGKPGRLRRSRQNVRGRRTVKHLLCKRDNSIEPLSNAKQLGKIIHLVFNCDSHLEAVATHDPSTTIPSEGEHGHG